MSYYLELGPRPAYRFERYYELSGTVRTWYVTFWRLHVLASWKVRQPAAV